MRISAPGTIVLIVFLMSGCGRTLDPVAPGHDPTESLSAVRESRTAADGNRVLWGFWRITISDDLAEVDVVPDRVAALHLNAVRLLEVTPCSTCLKVSNLAFHAPDTLTADVTLNHPFPGLLKYSAFDVRGIFITKADYLFPISGRSVAWSGVNGPKLLNGDGYTSLFNPTEFPEDKPGPPALRYIPGKYSTGGDLTARLNPFIAYKQDQPRRLFLAGSAETRSVDIRRRR